MFSSFLQSAMPSPVHTAAQCAARAARIDASFDAVEAIAKRIQAQMIEDGLIRQAGARTRAGDLA